MKKIIVPLMGLFFSINARADFAELVGSGDSHDAKFEFESALKFYLPAEQLNPKDADLLVKISRQYALRINDLPTKAQKIASCRIGLTYAERAVIVGQNRCDTHLSVAICLGKLTPFLSAKERIQASRKIKISAEKAVQLDPNNDYAWHVLGRWHQALANIGGTTRMMAGVIYGSLPAASNDEAIRCFQKAIALKPSRLLHTIELGRTYSMMGRNAEAKKLIEKGLSMPNKEKDDPETKQRGKETLAKIS